MTYCLAIKIKQGLIAVADSRITAGTQMTTAKKVILLGQGKHRFFIMTSGLRSIRDKTIAYLQKEVRHDLVGYNTMLEAITAYTKCLRQVEIEDRKYIEQANLSFNFHSIVGGILPGDSEPKLYMVYPEGNWIEVDQLNPYVTIGAIGYGKPILDRTLDYHTDMKMALKTAYLSFDSTKFSSSDVGFPIDIITYSAGDHDWRESNLDDDDMRELRLWWNQNITDLVSKSPDGPWLSNLLPVGA